MSTFSGVARVPNLLLTRLSLGNLGSINTRLLRVNQQLSTGQDITRGSEDPVRAASITEIDSRLERSRQSLRNLGLARASLETVDSSLADATDLLNQATAIASQQLSEGAGPDERRAQASVVQSIVDGMFRTATQESLVGAVFGGSAPGITPVEQFGAGFRIRSNTRSLAADAATGRGPRLGLPVTLGTLDAVGGSPGVVRGTVDLDPIATPETRLRDLSGGRSLGVTAQTLNFTVDGAAPVAVDLSHAETLGDVADALAAALTQYAADTGTEVLGPGGVTVGPTGLAFDVRAASLRFDDIGGSSTARDLGLAVTPSEDFNAGRSTSGVDLGVRLTPTTTVDALAGVSVAPLGSVRISNAGRTAVVDLSSAVTVDDVRRLIRDSGVGVRVEIAENGSGLEVVNEIAAASAQALSIEEVGDGTGTAAALGIRTLSEGTRLSDFNFGRGVAVVSGNGDPQFDRDFTLTLGDGFEIDIDLTPADTATVGSVLSAINSQIEAALTAAGRPATDLSAGLIDGANGLTLTQDPAIAGEVTVLRRNNSLAAEQLGLEGGVWDADAGRLVGEDRARVRVDSPLTHLLDLRDSLENDDDFGIALAFESLETSTERVTETRALAGGFARRVEQQITLEEDRTVLEENVRSTLFDTDFAAAATEFSLLQTQLEASLRTTALAGQLTLLNFLG